MSPSSPLRPALLLVMALSARAAAAVDIPQPTTHVADHAGVIPSHVEQQIDGWLTELEEKTAVQFVVLTLDSTAGTDIRQFGIELLNQWKLGHAGKDNGLLLTVAVKDRKYGIETGYGLEGLLPDAWLHEAATESLVPFFKRGDYGNGILQTVVAVSQRIASDAGVEIGGMPRSTQARRKPSRRGSPFAGLTFIIILIVLSALFRRGGGGRRRRRGWGGGLAEAMLWNAVLSGGGRSSSGWSGGRSSGGFSGGSFGGGGGGRFGGGGVSGGW